MELKPQAAHTAMCPLNTSDITATYHSEDQNTSPEERGVRRRRIASDLSQVAVTQGGEPALCFWKVTGLIPLVCNAEVSLGKILDPKLLLLCWLAPCMAATAVSVCLYELL